MRSTRWAPAAAILGGTVAGVFGGAALAQEAPETPALTDVAPRAFEPGYFRQFNPVTVEDMVRRIPGFTIDDGEDRRGFAATAGNVLVNGERPSSKTAISEQLSRISASDVLRIDLYSGGAESAAANGQTLYVDVRLKPRTTGATNTFVAQASLLDPSNSINPLIVLTSAFRAGSIDWNLALQAQPARRGRVTYDERINDASGMLLETSDEFLQGDYWEYRLSARGGYQVNARDRINLNIEATPSQDGRHTFSESRDPMGSALRWEDSKVTGDQVLATEVGGDWERRFSSTSSIKLIALASTKDTGSAERYSTIPVSSARRDTFIDRRSESGEYIARGVYSFRPATRHALQVGAEAAFNSLDSGLDVRVETVGLVLDRTPPVANTRVEERRGEAFVSDTWQASKDLRVDMSLTVETSKITQTGDAQQEREFTFLKPRINAVWDSGGPGEFRFLFERDVAQLDFTEFATAINNFDGTLSVGNPDLEPERTWRAKAEWERRFGAKGVVTLGLFHEDIEAVQDQIPIFIPADPLTNTPAQVLDGPGNIGDGRRFGINLDTTTPLDAIGVKGGELRINGLVQQTEATDPTTLRSRRLSDEADWSYSIDFRQALPGLKLQWGALYEDMDRVELFRSAELRTTGFIDPHIDLFVETTAFKPFVVRFTASDILKPSDVRERRLYDPSRTDPAYLSTIETRAARGSYGTRSYALRVSGRF
ncbi:MAG: TonB-dependent receptor [Hyphomonadaceae bacterium]